MDQAASPAPSLRPASAGFRVWHFWLLSGLVAVAIVEIQNTRQADAKLIGLAVGGFVLYALLGWGGWRFARRFRSRLGAMTLLAIYLAGMAGLYFVATVAYLVIEQAYRYGF